MLIGLALFPSGDYCKASGAFAGFFAGYLVESRYIRYEVRAPYRVRAARFACGLAVLLAIKIFVKHLLPDVPISHFLRYLLMGIWVTAIAPYLFKLLVKQPPISSSRE